MSSQLLVPNGAPREEGPMKVLKKLTLTLVLVLAAGIVIKSTRDVMRYLKIREM